MKNNLVIIQLSDENLIRCKFGCVYYAGLLPRGGGGECPLEQLAPSETQRLLLNTKILSKKLKICNRTIEICMTIDFAPLEKFLEESYCRLNCSN